MLCRGVSFQRSEAPLVSILVTAYGNLPLTMRCLRALTESAITVPHEVIVSEDHSGDQEMTALASIPGLRYVSQPKNLGFLRNANALAFQAAGTYIAFLNNDALVQPGWLDALLSVFERFPDCGAAGSLLLFPDGRVQEAGGIVWADARCMNYGRGDISNKSDYSFTRVVDYVSAASILMRRDVFLSLGGFDTFFAPAYYEDTDLAFRLRRQGLQTYFEPRSRVTHEEGGSYGRTRFSKAKRRQWLNRIKFRARWKQVLVQQCRASAQNISIACDRLSANGHAELLVEDDVTGGHDLAIQLALVLRKAGHPTRISVRSGSVDTEKLKRSGIEVINIDFGETISPGLIASRSRAVSFLITSEKKESTKLEDLASHKANFMVIPGIEGSWSLYAYADGSFVAKLPNLSSDHSVNGALASVLEQSMVAARSAR